MQQLGAQGVDEEKLSKQLEKMDLSSGSNGGAGGVDAKKVLETVSSYLTSLPGMAEEQVKSLVEQAEGVLGQVGGLLGIKTTGSAAGEGESEKAGEVKEEGKDGKKTVVIDDVRAWKASLPASRGPRMVRELSEFEEVGAKL